MTQITDQNLRIEIDQEHGPLLFFFSSNRMRLRAGGWRRTWSRSSATFQGFV